MANSGARATAGEVQLIRGSSVDKPLVRLIQQSAQALASDTDVAITFGASSEDFDTAGWHDVATNTSRIIPVGVSPCYVRLRGTVWYATDTDVIVYYASVGKNGTIVERTQLDLPSTALSATRPRSVQVVCEQACNGSTDYFELFGRQLQSAAGSLNTNVAAGGFSSTFSLEYLRPQ